MISQEIRRNFLKYFKEKGHAIIASSSVVPHDDPTLLFINAGTAVMERINGRIDWEKPKWKD